MAEDAKQQGDDSYNRIYRPVPQYVIRERALRKNYPGLFLGLESAIARAGGDNALDGRLRAGGYELADSESSEDSSQDYGPEADQP